MFSYETLDVYKKSVALNKIVYAFLKNDKHLPHYLKNQLGRASLSIMLNIAEGSAKFSPKDRRNFLITARASSFECAALVTMMHSEQEIGTDVFTTLKTGYEQVSTILYWMIKRLE